MIYFRVIVKDDKGRTIHVSPWRKDSIKACKSAIHINVSLGRTFEVHVSPSKPEEYHE